MAWAKNGTPDTLTSSGTTIEITDLTAKKFNVFLCHELQTGGTINPRRRYNGSSSTVYANRRSKNGTADVTDTSDTGVRLLAGTIQQDHLDVSYVCSISGEEKLGIIFAMRAGSSGAANAPDRVEWATKFVPSPDADITQVSTIEDGGTGSFDTDSNLSALAGDVTETATLQDGTIFEETDTNKSYIWNSSTTTWTQL